MFRNSDDSESLEEDNISQCEKEGMNFVGGYICFKLAEKFNWLGEKTKNSSNCSKWMSLKSTGDLYMPSQKLQDFLRSAELIFTRFHANTLSLEKKPITRVSSILELKFPEYPPEMISLYSRTRFFLRLKTLNNNLNVQEKHNQMRHANHVNKYK